MCERDRKDARVRSMGSEMHVLRRAIKRFRRVCVRETEGMCECGRERELSE